MPKFFLIIAALTGALAVMLGAFAAHGLKPVLSADNLQVFETAVRYQFYHVLALLATGILLHYYSNRFIKWAGRLFISGMVLFSGSLYLLCYIRHVQLPATWVGAITPLGGVCFIAGWLLLAYGLSKNTTAPLHNAA
ncbi:MAG: hypothetical protein RL172_2938 [Bacteroidota bacterium]|jgi:uncharacterized membrane protein YgdD (TMEM256/DUF423 family)